MPDGRNVVSVSGLVKRYVGGPVIGPIDFSVEPGQILAIAGTNGAGKSTVLRMLLGLSSCDEGEALVFGQPYRHLKNPGLQVGAFLGGRLGDESMTGKEHLAFMTGMIGVRHGPHHVRQAIRACGLQRWPLLKIRQYSTGMRQRLGIAGAIVAHAPLLVLDEPFNGLDIEGRIWLHEALRRWSSEGKTIIIAAHDMEELERVASHIVIIMQGRQKAFGPLRQVLGAYGGAGTAVVFQFSDSADERGKAGTLHDLTAMGAVLHEESHQIWSAQYVNPTDIFTTAARNHAPLCQLESRQTTLRAVMTTMLMESQVAQ